MDLAKISVMGTGSWGTALAILLYNNGHQVMLWSAHPEKAVSLNETREDSGKLPGVKIPEGIVITSDDKAALTDVDVTVFASPSAYIRKVSRRLAPYVRQRQIIVNVAKGVEENTLMPVCDIIKEEIPQADVCVLSGPSHAEEVSVGIPTAIVIASKDEEVRNLVQETFMNEKMRVYTSDDVIGVELGGALKNIIAFCAGIATEIDLGDNSFAALITRGLVEITRLGTAMGGKHDTFYGLSGLGDLIVTCMSEHSRNRRAGRLIGKGYTVEQARKEIGMVIESIDNIEVAYALSKKYNIEMPIVNAVYDVLYNGLEPRKAVTMLMTRAKKSE